MKYLLSANLYFYQNSACCTERKRRKKKKKKEKRLEQYNSNDKLIHSWTVRQQIQPTSHTHAHTHTLHSKSDEVIYRKKVEGVQILLVEVRFEQMKSQHQLII